MAVRGSGTIRILVIFVPSWIVSTMRHADRLHLADHGVLEIEGAIIGEVDEDLRVTGVAPAG